MKAILCREIMADIGGLRVEDVALPDMKPDELRIRVRAAGVNFPDILTVQGKYQTKPPLPFVPGLEGAGDVIALGSEASGFSLGDRVVARGLGFYAEEAQIPASAVRKMPAGIDYKIGGSFNAAYLTAYVALVRRARIEAGEWLLVHGAAGGVGLAALDLGRALGAKVIATASTREKRDFLISYGADHVLPPSGFREAVKDLTGGGANVIFDPVGGDVFDESARCIAFDGRLLVVGFTSGRIPSISVNMPLIKGYSVVGVRAGEYVRKFPAKGRENLAAIDAMVAAGKIHPHVCAAFPLAEAVQAMRMLENRQVIGKVVIEP
jgi:NADPH2:quinone reductase